MGKLNPPARVKQRNNVPYGCYGWPQQGRYNNKKVNTKRNPMELHLLIDQRYGCGVNPRNSKKNKEEVRPMPVATNFDRKRISLAFCYNKLWQRPSKKFYLIFGAFFAHRSLHLFSDVILCRTKNKRNQKRSVAEYALLFRPTGVRRITRVGRKIEAHCAVWLCPPKPKNPSKSLTRGASLDRLNPLWFL